MFDLELDLRSTFHHFYPPKSNKLLQPKFANGLEQEEDSQIKSADIGIYTHEGASSLCPMVASIAGRNTNHGPGGGGGGGRNLGAQDCQEGKELAHPSSSLALRHSSVPPRWPLSSKIRVLFSSLKLQPVTYP